MKKILTCLLLIAALSTAQANARQLRVVTLENPPMEYKGPKAATGFNIDVSTEALKRMGINATIRFYPWPRCLLMVEKGTADALIDVAHNKDRAEYMYFPKEQIYNSKYYMYKLTGRDISLSPDLDNTQKLSLGIVHAYYYGGAVEQAIADGKFKRTEDAWSEEQNIMKLLAGRIDMILGEKMTVDYLLNKLNAKNKVSVVRETGTHTPLLISTTKTYIGFSKKSVSPILVEKFSKTLRQMRLDGTIRWFKEKYQRAPEQAAGPQ